MTPSWPPTVSTKDTSHTTDEITVCIELGVSKSWTLCQWHYPYRYQGLCRTSSSTPRTSGVNSRQYWVLCQETPSSRRHTSSSFPRCLHWYSRVKLHNYADCSIHNIKNGKYRVLSDKRDLKVCEDSSSEWTDTSESPSVTVDEDDPLLTNTDLARILVTTDHFEHDPPPDAGPVMTAAHRVVNEVRRVNFANNICDPWSPHFRFGGLWDRTGLV